MSFIHNIGNRAPKGGFALNNNSIQSKGLLHWLPMSEGGGLVARDLAGNADGVLTNTAPSIWTHSDFGNSALTFDGSNDGVELGAPLPDFIGGGFSISGWLAPNVASTFDRPVVIHGTGATTFFAVQIETDDTMSIGYRPATTGFANQFNTAVNVVNTGLHHFACSIDIDNQIWLLAVDGIIASGFDAFIDNFRFEFRESNINLGIKGGSNPYGGGMFDFRFYDFALKESDVNALYNPQTRWELYAQQERRVAFSPDFVPPVGLPIPVAMHHYRQMRM